MRSLLAIGSVPVAWLPAPSSAVLPRLEALRRRADSVVLPLYALGDSAFCTEYRVDGQRFRAVVDTGSPFLLVLSDRKCAGGPERWGCFATGGEHGELDDVSLEGFGGQDVGVEWRRGALRLSTLWRERDDVGLADRRGGARAGPWTFPREATDLVFEPINFGVVRAWAD